MILVPDGFGLNATLSRSSALPVATGLCTAATVTVTETVTSMSVSTSECQSTLDENHGDASTTLIDAGGSTIVHPPAATEIDDDGDQDDGEQDDDQDENDEDDDDELDEVDDNDNIFAPVSTPPQALPPAQSEVPIEFEDGDETTNTISQTVTLPESIEVVQSFDPEQGFVEVTISHPAQTITEVVEQTVTVSRAIILTTLEEDIAATQIASPGNGTQDVDEAEESTEDNAAIVTG